MAETRTLKFGLPQWSSGQTDSPSREDFNEAFLNIENLAARIQFGPLADRPLPSIIDRIYVDESGTFYRDTGSAWVQIGFPKNAVKITKTEGTDPGIWIEVPVSLGADAIRTTHDTKIRFRVQANGDVVASSTRLYQSDTPAPANNLPHTVALATKAASASGVSIYGQNAQAANLLETKSAAGANLSEMTPSGDVNALGRLMAGTLVPQDAQLFVQGNGAARPVALLRTPNNGLTANTAMQVETMNGSLGLLKLDGTGRLAVGSRNNKTILAGDSLAMNLNYTGANGGATEIEQARAVFRNTSSGYGVAGLSLVQQPGDTAASASLGIFAGGTAAGNDEAPERVRLGDNAEKHGARFLAVLPDWTPLAVRAVLGQTAPLLSIQSVNKDILMQVGSEGTTTVRNLIAQGADQNVFGGGILSGGEITGSNLRAVQGAGAGAGVLSQINKAAAVGSHFLAQDEDGKKKAVINRDGTLEIASDAGAVQAGAVLLTMRGQQYRQNGRKLQSFDVDSGKWGSISSAFSAEYYATISQDVDDAWVTLKWGGETNDSEGVYDWTTDTGQIKVPFTGLYDVRALGHVRMAFTGGGAGTFMVNGVRQDKYRRDFSRTIGFDTVSLILNDLVPLNKNDVIEFQLRIDSWLARVPTLLSGEYRSRLSIRFAGTL